ncbi:MAG: response regulator transcription factor [Hydrogenophaga sp.]|nr:response regulator transcription factor [Hydrogenophaga sp.]
MIQIAIVDDHAIVRTGLRQFLGEQVDLRVTGEAANGREALELVRQVPVDVLLMDLSMPGQGGVEALQAIKARHPDLPVLILSGFPASQYAPALLSQGASGYLNKECDPQEIVDAIRVVARGRRYLGPEVAELLAGRALGDAGQPPHEALSERELQVFLRLARGETVGGIAESMYLSVKTVSTYRTRVLTKLGLGGNSELTYYAVRNGLID